MREIMIPTFENNCCNTNAYLAQQKPKQMDKFNQHDLRNMLTTWMKKAGEVLENIFSVCIDWSLRILRVGITGIKLTGISLAAIKVKDFILYGPRFNLINIDNRTNIEQYVVNYYPSCSCSSEFQQKYNNTQTWNQNQTSSWA